MARRALCVGINDYLGEGNNLNGCITYAELVERLRDLIAADYSLDPQLEGKDENKRKRIFS